MSSQSEVETLKEAVQEELDIHATLLTALAETTVEALLHERSDAQLDWLLQTFAKHCTRLAELLPLELHPGFHKYMKELQDLMRRRYEDLHRLRTL